MKSVKANEKNNNENNNLSQHSMSPFGSPLENDNNKKHIIKIHYTIIVRRSSKIKFKLSAL